MKPRRFDAGFARPASELTASSAPLLRPPPGASRLILGLQPVRAAIRARGATLGALLLEDLENPRLAAVARFARDQGLERVEAVGRPALDRLSEGVVHQGVAAWAPELAFTPLEPLLEDASFLGLALDRIQDPQNFGAVLRSAVALNASCVLWGEHGSAPLGPATQRAAAGAIEFVRLCRVASLPKALATAQAAGVQIIGLDGQAERRLSECALRQPTLLVVGSEHTGMTPAVRRACGSLARLVEASAVESLNASVAAAVALYEARSQRDSRG